jgi:hypothetical protein
MSVSFFVLFCRIQKDVEGSVKIVYVLLASAEALNLPGARKFFYLSHTSI